MLLLCVDDDLEDVEIFQEAVGMISVDYTCIVARNGSEALSLLKTIIPDFIFLDINMPVMDGKETLRSIRSDKRFQSVPVIILSTSGNKTDMAICRQLGANSFLVKPSSFDELLETLRKVL